MELWIIGGVTFYMLVMLGIGYWASKQVKNTKDFIIAGGQIGWLLSFGSIFATWFGAETCMGSSSTAHEKGILGVIADPFGAGLCLILFGILFAKFFRKLGIETMVDYFELRYGNKVAAWLGLIYIPVYIGWIGAQLLAFGIILNSLTQLPIMPSILVSTAVVLIYTYLGGMLADIYADFFNMVILVAGLIVIFPFFLNDVGGFAQAKSSIPANFFHFYPHSSSVLDWLNYFQAWMIVGIGSLPAQDLLQRTMASKTPAIARWTSIAAGFAYVLMGMLPVLMGIFGRLVLPDSPGESILINLCIKYLPGPLIALMIGALLAAIMSSADSALLAPSSIIGRNIVQYFHPHASERFKLFFCRGSVLVIGILSLLIAVYFQNIYRLCQESWGVLLTGVAAPLIAGVFWKRANSSGALAAGVFGVGVWMTAKFLTPENYPHNLIGFAASWLALILVSLMTQREVKSNNHHIHNLSPNHEQIL
jgi:SSS family transporter